MSKLTEHMIAALESANYRAYDAGRIDGEHVRTGWQILGKIPAATRKAMHTRGLMFNYYYLTQEGVKARESVMPSESVQEVSPTLELVRAVQNGETPVAAVIQNTPGMSDVTHYHSPACADVKREMKRWGQSENDVMYATFSTIADILEFEYGDVASDENERNTPKWWASIMENSTEMVRIMPCLSIPAGRVGNSPLVATGNFFRAGFDIPESVDGIRAVSHADTRRAEGVARIVEKVRETATRKADSTPESDWHIFTGKEWLSIRYAGMPVNHWDGTTWYPVVYRHRVEECNSASCDFHPGSVVTAPLATSVIKIGALIGVVTGRTAENGTLFEFTVSGGEYPEMWTAIVGPWAYVAKAEVPAPVVEREKFRITEYRDCMGEEQVHRTGCADIERARRMGRVLNGAECIYNHEIESILEFGIDYWGDIATDTTEDGSPEWEAECISLAEGMHWHNCTRGMNIPTR